MKNVVLVGGGHAHLYCLRALMKEQINNIKIKLISPSPYQYYSGMFSGFAEGFYSLDDIHIDLRKIAEQANVTFIQQFVKRVDPLKKQVVCTNGNIYPFDVISFDIGSRTEEISAFKEWLVPIKPNYLFAKGIQTFREQDHPVIVGGGASGVELGLSILAWQKRNKQNTNVTLISSSHLLPHFGDQISKKIESISMKKGLQVVPHEKVVKINKNELITDKNRTISQSQILWLTGPKADSLFKTSNLPCSDDGFLLVKETLQNVKFSFIFGAGDCVTIREYNSIPKNGVNAVRQAPILWENIKRYLVHDSCLSFTPQKNFLAILSTGNGEALLTYGRMSLYGKNAWKIKNKIDKHFMNKYQS
jgi:pyridine nucleotide-disulfide oxidoreductase family protein